MKAKIFKITFLIVSSLLLSFASVAQTTCALTINDNNPGTYMATIYVLDYTNVPPPPPDILYTEQAQAAYAGSNTLWIYYNVEPDVYDKVFRLYVVVVKNGTTTRTGFSVYLNSDEYQAGNIAVSVTF